MDPITFWLLMSGLGGAGAAGAALLYRLMKGPRLPELPPMPEPKPPEIPVRQDGIIDAEELEEEEDDSLLSDKDVVKQIVGGIGFSAQYVQVGERVVGQRFLGYREEESIYPDDDMTVRPIRDVAEMASLLGSENAQDDDILYARIARGEALVTAYTTQEEVFEDVHEPVMEARRRTLYILLDLSPSMFPKHSRWRWKIWGPLVLMLLQKAFQNQVVFLMRYFGGTVSKLMRAVSQEEVAKLERSIRSAQWISSTDITAAVYTALRDFDDEEYDNAQVVLITDGEHNQGTFNPSKVRKAFDDRNVTLHAILLGVKNDGLRQAAHSYVQVDHHDRRGLFTIINQV